jgi:urease accessory protein
VFADTFRIGGAVAAALDRPATLAGARATAVLIYVATDAASRLEAVRAMLGEAASMIAASTWNGLLVVRGYARDGRTLQGDIAPLVRMLSGRALPRVWQC